MRSDPGSLDMIKPGRQEREASGLPIHCLRAPKALDFTIFATVILTAVVFSVACFPQHGMYSLDPTFRPTQNPSLNRSLGSLSFLCGLVLLGTLPMFPWISMHLFTGVCGSISRGYRFCHVDFLLSATIFHLPTSCQPN